MLPIEFKPQKQYELIRLGQNNDGGYLVDKKSLNDSLFKTNIFHGCKFPPDAALADFSSKSLSSSFETGDCKNARIELLCNTASVTFII